MVTKVILILSIVVAGAAGFFGWKTKSSLRDTRDTTKAENATFDTASKLDAETIEILSNETKRDKDLLDDIAEQESQANDYDRQMTQLANSMTQIEEEMAELGPEEKRLQALIDSFPPGVTIDTLEGRMDDLGKQKIELEDGVLTLTAEYETFVAQQSEITKSVSAMQERRTEKVKTIKRNAFTANIVSVDHDWGFTIVNAGENKGITADSKLIVVRGGQRIGALQITKIEPTRLIADIVPKSQTVGMRIMQGDEVILAKTL